MPGDGTNQHTGTEYEQSKIEALRLRLAGASFDQIAATQDITKSGAYKRVNAALEDMRPHAEYDIYRRRQMAEMEEVRTRLMRKVLENDDLIEAARELRGLWDSERKLLKLDEAPTPMELQIRRLATLSDDELAIEAVGHLIDPEVIREAVAELDSGGNDPSETQDV